MRVTWNRCARRQRRSFGFRRPSRLFYPIPRRRRGFFVSVPFRRRPVRFRTLRRKRLPVPRKYAGSRQHGRGVPHGGSTGVRGRFPRRKLLRRVFPKVLRAGMGSVFRLPLFREAQAPAAVRRLNEAGFATLAAVPHPPAVSVTSLRYSVPSVAVIGNEGSGLTPETCTACSARVSIPMAGRAESLNATAAAAILMWEMVRGKAGGGCS